MIKSNVLFKHKLTSIFQFYVLNSIKQNSKSGYDIIKEIKFKTNNNINPSKGTIYPLLDTLKSEKLIKLDSIGQRNKRIFSLTKKGSVFLDKISKEKYNIHQKLKYVPLLFENFNLYQNHNNENYLIMKVIYLVCNNTNNNSEIEKVLIDCIKNLKKVCGDKNVCNNCKKSNKKIQKIHCC